MSPSHFATTISVDDVDQVKAATAPQATYTAL